MKQVMLLMVLLPILITGCRNSSYENDAKLDAGVFVTKLSMKQIDSLTAEYNYYFVKINAAPRLSSRHKITGKTGP